MEGIVMKNIQERAKEWSEHIVETTPYDVVDGKACVFVEDRDIADVAEESYIKGATDQKAIDLEKAKTAFGKACGWLSIYTWYGEVFEEFIKNMEE